MNKRTKFKMIIRMKNKSNKKRSIMKVRIANKIKRIKMISNFKKKLHLKKKLKSILFKKIKIKSSKF